MEQVAHQTIVMQFILELAKSLKVDPRGCFRQFFEKIKVTSWPKRFKEPKWKSHSSFVLEKIETYFQFKLCMHITTRCSFCKGQYQIQMLKA